VFVRDIISDLRSAFEIDPVATEFDVAVAKYVDDQFSRIWFKTVDAFHWDDDEEFFLIPTGLSEKYYGVAPNITSAGALLKKLEHLSDKYVLSYALYVRDRIGRLSDESVVSVNEPLWATGVQSEGRIVYFYYGSRPQK
jgi:hypothetical protein